MAKVGGWGDLPGRSSLDGAGIVVIEIDKAVREAAMALLVTWGCCVLSGDAVEEVGSAILDTGFEPEVILSDLLLTRQPGEDALTAMPRLMQRIGSRCPVILMTGDTDPNWLPKVQAVGWTLLIKPFRPQDLYDAVARALSVARRH